MSEEDVEEEAIYSDYPIVGHIVCPVVGCSHPIPIHARLKVSVYFTSDSDRATPCLGFDTDVFPDEVALHMYEHGGEAKFYTSLGEFYDENREDDDE